MSFELGWIALNLDAWVYVLFFYLSIK